MKRHRSKHPFIFGLGHNSRRNTSVVSSQISQSFFSKGFDLFICLKKKMPLEDAKALKKEEAEDDNKSLSSLVKKKATNANNAVSKKLKREEKEDDDDDKPIRSSSSGSRSKPVAKKEMIDEDDDDDKPIRSSSSGSRSKPVKKKEGIDEDDEKKPVSMRNSSAGVSKEKKKTEKEEETKKKRERKVYDLPGQKRPQPEERDPLRIFYESLYKQIPTSDMAQIWLMESGLLPAEKAKKVLEKKLQKAGKFSSPTKSAASTPRSNSKSVPVKKKEAKKSPSEALSDKKKGNDPKPTTKKRKKTSDDNSDDGSDDDFLASRVSKKLKAK
ncbi:hypothetical protein CARUB_v10009729mg [Capsella rubella]|uniref:Uncharacterized protein n=2 Tax=Capsella rubella TaxID=81985 RepID=R0GQN8_9BRAS|nr:hypothetical protein CARUB_v10009729mg [Capsella rubella]